MKFKTVQIIFWVEPMIRKSKFRNVHCTAESREYWHDELHVSTARFEGSLLTCTSNHLAFPHLKNQGATIEIRRLDAIGKTAKHHPCLLYGHGGQVNALSFSPFEEHLLASGSSDQTIKLWKIPPHDNETNKEIKVPVQLDIAFQDSILGMVFHPSASQILAVHGKVEMGILDINRGEIQTPLFKDDSMNTITSMAWNYDGSLLSLVGKDQKMRLLDPRVGESVTTFPVHDGRKGARVVWTKDLAITVGFSRMMEREIKLWDARHVEKPIARVRLDTGTGMLMPFIDLDTNLLFLGSKGDRSVRFYEVDRTTSPMLHRIDQVTTHNNTVGMALLPKRSCDGSKCEIAKLLNLTTSSIEPLSFRVPRKEAKQHFQADLYPDTASKRAALSSEDYWKGQNAPPVLDNVTLAYFDSGAVPAHTTKESKNTTDVVEGGGNWNTGTGWGGDKESDKQADKRHEDQKEHHDDILTSSPAATPPDARAPPAELSEKAQRLGSRQKNKLHYLQGSVHPTSETYFNFKPDVTSSLSSPLLAASTAYWAAATQGGCGPVYVSPINQTGKVSVDAPLLRGHSQPVLDLAFSPFHENILATGSDDGTIRVWDVESRASQHLLKGHTKGLRTVDFHPVADDILVTTGADKTLRIWDIEAGSEFRCIRDKFTDTVLNVSFNGSGNVVATLCRDRILRVVDLRASESIVTAMGCGHEGRKGQLVEWCHENGDGHLLFTTGFNNNSERQMSFWDARNLVEPLSTTTIDASGSLLLPIYDASSKVIYLASKGNRTILSYEISKTGSSPTALPCTPFTGLPSPLCGIAMLPKRMCNVKEIEVARFLCLSQTSVYPISMHLPRSNTLQKYFQDDIFGMTESGISSLLASEWCAGETSSRPVVSLQPLGMEKVSCKPKEKKNVLPVVAFRQKMEKDQEEQRITDDNFKRLQSLAAQRAVYHPNLSGKTSEAAELEEEDSDDNWDD